MPALYPNRFEPPFTMIQSERSDFQIQCVCITSTPAAPAPVPWQRGVSENKMPNPLSSLMPGLQRPGQIVLQHNGSEGKTPKEMGQKGGFIAWNLSPIASERFAGAQERCFGARKTQKCPNVGGARCPAFPETNHPVKICPWSRQCSCTAISQMVDNH